MTSAAQLRAVTGGGRTRLTVTRQPNGTFTPGLTVCNALPGAAARPEVTVAMVTAQVQKLLPRPAVRTTGVNSPTLVNIDTIFWIATPVERTLGTVTLLGYRVDLRAHLDGVAWEFGDGVTDSTTSPEPAYRASDPCDTVHCAGYYSHIYSVTGTPTISASIMWSGEYRLDRGPWLRIPGTVTAPAAPITITVHQARGILVPNPGQH